MGSAISEKPKLIDAAILTLKGDPSVGIPSTSLTISEIGFDLNALSEEDQNDALEEFRSKLADAFEVAWGDRPQVFFDTEIPID